MRVLGKWAGGRQIGPLDYSRRWSMRLGFGFTLLFLYAPILTLVAFSFNDSRRNIVWRGFTLKYYEKAMNNDGLIEAFTNSLTIAFINTLIATLLGILQPLLIVLMGAIVMTIVLAILLPIFEINNI